MILVFTDIEPGRNHSSMEGLIKKSLTRFHDIQVVSFSNDLKENTQSGNVLTLMRKYKRNGLLNCLKEFFNIDNFEFIIVRNIFSVLSQVQQVTRSAKLGFWESFPHSYQQVEKAERLNRSILRKKIIYYFRSRYELKLISKCDFYLPITDTHKKIYYPDLKVPYFPTPMGFDFSEQDFSEKNLTEAPIRFVYIGAISKLRNIDVVNQAFMDAKGEFRLDYYSTDDNDATDEIKALTDGRIHFKGALGREELLEEIQTADVGLCFFPDTKTYITASPTKTLEYAALGLALLINEVPEYKNLFDEKSAFMCDFNRHDICKTVDKIISQPKEKLHKMGKEAFDVVKEKRNYEYLGEQLNKFLSEL